MKQQKQISKNQKLINRFRPFFSILIPSYNRPIYLKKSIDSVLKNQFKSYEIIVSDDNSPTDKEIDRIIRPYLSYKNFTFFKQSINLGMSQNWNFLVSVARGRFILIMGDDDELLPFSLERIYNYICKYNNFTHYCFGYKVIDEKGAIQFSRYSPTIFDIVLKESSKSLHHFLEGGIFPFWVFHPFTICYKNTSINNQKYKKRACIGSDLLYLMESINSQKSFFVIPEVLFLWRKFKKNESNTNLSREKNASIFARVEILHFIYEERNRFDPIILKVLDSYAFRLRFLYDPIIASKNFTENNLNTLKLNKVFYNELMVLLRKNKKSLVSHNLRIKYYQISEFLRFFGYKGLLRLCLYFWHFIRLRI